MKRLTWSILVSVGLLLFLAGARAQADPAQHDGLTLLGPGHHYVDPNGKALDLYAFHSKYKEKIVGIYFSAGHESLHFYMNATVWDKLKQRLIHARDQWQTLADTEFKSMGAVEGYRAGNQRVTMRLGIQGATTLAPKQLFLVAEGGAAKPQRIFVYLQAEELKRLVNDFSVIDGLLGGAGK
jgi:hypothetical protein